MPCAKATDEANMYRILRDLTRPPATKNVSSTEKWISIGGGLLLIGKGLARPGPMRLVKLALGAAAVYRGARGYSSTKQHLRRVRAQRVTPTAPRT
ncbi:hypothetical protein FA869_11500 [Halopseudomonas bauzanensis]|jgi:uncharacterized membrane protein|uniref:DUF2892 domain-containing protein n=2 Tax=Halopseudomonas bauzanensis TaxID=653930 RepID=A0A1I4JSD6_9GAMM|nr:hypothetical protein FA869_11500 [Halopseudomonas bauzanensis]SFL69479.1 hypothetical protein SAMN04487855_0752 [Halopseudomonas bauzanensis]